MGPPYAPLRTSPPAELVNGLLDLVDSLGTAVLLVEESGRILFANWRASELLGRIDAPHENHDVATLLAPLATLLREQDDQAPRRPTVRVRHEETERVFEYSVSLARRRDPEPLYAIAFQDVTHIVQLEQERDRLLKLATVGELMPSLLHETKNPLAAAVTSLELLIEDHSSPELQQELHGVLVEIRRALLSLDGLGSVGRSLRTPRSQAVDHAVKEVVSLLEARARRHGVTLVADVPALPLLRLDPSSVRALVLNLATNAIQACSDGGCEVVVRARLAPGELGENTFSLEVIDTGSGMSPEVLAHCTDLFFTTKRSGSGIGLALCRRLVEDAGGELRIESTVGRGTHITIQLGLDESRASLPSFRPPTGKPTGGEHGR